MIKKLLYNCFHQTLQIIHNRCAFRLIMQISRYPFTAILITFIWLQAMDVRFCYQGQVEEIFTKLNDIEPLYKKRSQIAGTSVGKPEEIFSAKDQIESNYDEYPMIVPKKKAALLLDRLMIALHQALDRKQNVSRFIDNVNSDRNDDYSRIRHNENEYKNGEISKDTVHDEMYSDDEPDLGMDYNFRDLNSIHRATGQTVSWIIKA
uniref:Uncharacterized protein n=1 Tax=Glossina brevipalpis TaxID=37001 RepID=A0A1A9WBH8_9MUSC